MSLAKEKNKILMSKTTDEKHLIYLFKLDTMKIKSEFNKKIIFISCSMKRIK